MTESNEFVCSDGRVGEIYAQLLRAIELRDKNSKRELCNRILPEIKNYPVYAEVFLLAATDTRRIVLEFLLTEFGSLSLKAQDSGGRNLVHYAAFYQKYSRSPPVLSMIVSKIGARSPVLLMKCRGGRTAAHYAAINKNSSSSLRWLIETQNVNLLFIEDKNRDTAFCLAIQHQDVFTVQALLSKIGVEKLLTRDSLERNALYFAVQNENSIDVIDVVCQVLDSANRSSVLRFLQGSNYNGTFLHQCALAFNGKNVARLVRGLAPVLNYPSPQAALKNSLDDAGRNPLFYALVGKIFQLLFEDIVDLREHQCIDTEGNTLLHALFYAFDLRATIDAEQLANAARVLIQAEVNPLLENSRKLNCLLATNIDTDSLSAILAHLADTELKRTFKKLQSNSEGLHAAHLFCGRYDIRKLESSLSRLFDLSPSELWSIRVSDGPLKGATCLHFACAAGNVENIEHLLDNGLSLFSQTVAEQTCIDFACDSGKLHVLIKASVCSNIDLSEILKSVDLPKRALQLPDLQSARACLRAYRPADMPVGVVKRFQEAVFLPTEVEIIIDALKRDSSEMLRSMLKLNLNTDVSSVSILMHYDATGVSDESEDSTFDELVEILAFMRFADLRVKCLNCPVSECAIRHQKPKFLSDWMLLNQFEIIPRTMQLIIRISNYRNTNFRKINKILDRTPENKLFEPYEHALTQVINVLEVLFHNASSHERDLLIDYMEGNFTDSKSDPGPKFACKESSGDKGAKAVVELAFNIDSDELFATKCMIKLVNRRWNMPSEKLFPSEMIASRCTIPRMMIRQKFIVHFGFLSIFAFFFSWYLVDFGRTLENPAADIILLMYSLSLIMQDFTDSYLNVSPIFNFSSRKKHTNKSNSVLIHMSKWFYGYDQWCSYLLFAAIVMKFHARVSNPGLLYNCHIVMSTSLLFFVVRVIRILGYFRRAGTILAIMADSSFNIAMTLSIVFVFICAFGIFFYTLLFPIASASDVRDGAAVMQQLLLLPSSLVFGYFERAEFLVCGSGNKTNWSDCVDPTGYNAFKILMFAFLIIVNILLWNIMIGQLNETVKGIQPRVQCIWRRHRCSLLKEMTNMSPIPLPFSFVDYTMLIGVGCWKRYKKNRASIRAVHADDDEAQEKPSHWWQERQSFANYPQGYRRFLTFQAEQLRRHRGNLRRPIESGRSNTEKCIARTQNLQTDLQDNLARLTAELKYAIHDGLGKHARPWVPRPPQ